MDLECNIVLSIMHGDGPPTSAPDPDRHHPVYVDDASGRVWVHVGSQWLPVNAPIDWMKASMLEALQSTDELTINIGGRAGDAEGGDYRRSTMSELVPLVAGALHLYDLADVELAGVEPNDVLLFSFGRWRNGEQRMQLDDLTDVNAKEPVSGEALVKDASGWVARRPELALDDVEDVDAAAPADRQVLAYSASDRRWHAAIMSMRLGELSDVVDTPVDRDALLVFDGETWRTGAGHAVPMAVCVKCADDAPSGLPAGTYVLVTSGLTALYRVGDDAGLDEVPAQLHPPVLVCCSSASVWAKAGAGYIRANYIPTSVAAPVMVLPCVKEGCDDSGFGAGTAYLDLRGEPTIRVKGSDVCPPYDPKIVFCTGACESCGVYVKNPATGKLTPGGFKAGDVCVQPCSSGPINTAMDAQQAICLLSESSGGPGMVGPCVQVGAVPPTIQAPVSVDDAFCQLDAAIGDAQNQIASFAGGQVGPCASGPVNAAMSLQDAICTLSSSAAPLLPVPIAASDVTIDACSSGPVNAATTLQDAICSISAAADSRTIPATSVQVNACSSGPVNANMDLQAAICALYGDSTVSSGVVEYVTVLLSGDGGYTVQENAEWHYYPDFFHYDVGSPSGLFDVDVTKTEFGGHMIKVNPAAVGKPSVSLIAFFSANTKVVNQDNASAKLAYVVGNTAATTLENVAGFTRAESSVDYWSPFSWFGDVGGSSLIPGSTYNGVAPQFIGWTEASLLQMVQPSDTYPIGMVTLLSFLR